MKSLSSPLNSTPVGPPPITTQCNSLLFSSSDMPGFAENTKKVNAFTESLYTVIFAVQRMHKCRIWQCLNYITLFVQINIMPSWNHYKKTNWCKVLTNAITSTTFPIIWNDIPGTSDSIRLRRSFLRISCAWWTSRRKIACSLTPRIPKVEASAPDAMTNLSYETLNFHGSRVSLTLPSVTVSQCTLQYKTENFRDKKYLIYCHNKSSTPNG